MVNDDRDMTEAAQSEDAGDLDAGVPPEVLADERASARKALRRLHKPAEEGGALCDWCRLPYPCPDSDLDGG